MQMAASWVSTSSTRAVLTKQRREFQTSGLQNKDKRDRSEHRIIDVRRSLHNSFPPPPFVSPADFLFYFLVFFNRRCRTCCFGEKRGTKATVDCEVWYFVLQAAWYTIRAFLLPSLGYCSVLPSGISRVDLMVYISICRYVSFVLFFPPCHVIVIMYGKLYLVGANIMRYRSYHVPGCISCIYSPGFRPRVVAHLYLFRAGL